LVEKLAGETDKGAVAARRMLMLSRAAARACRILPPPP
jgi:putative membrane protein